jgi:hypothetical protein
MVITGLSIRFISLTPGFIKTQVIPLHLMTMVLSAWRKVGGNSDYLVSLPVAASLDGSSSLGDTKPLLMTPYTFHYRFRGTMVTYRHKTMPVTKQISIVNF